jgi:hypothetical protein
MRAEKARRGIYNIAEPSDYRKIERCRVTSSAVEQR